MASSPPPPPALPDVLVEEILLRLPPDEPAYLVRVALVCETWCRILSDPGFRRRFREFHRSPPLLGYIHNRQFVPTFTTTASPFSPPTRWWALDCRHGRVLIDSNDDPRRLIVWDPITGDQHQMPDYPREVDSLGYDTGAVLCAVDGCDHLDCHGGPFLVVLVGMDHFFGPFSSRYDGWATVYSSDTGAWSDQAFCSSYCSYYCSGFVERRPSLLIGDSLYFTHESCFSFLKYDLNDHDLSIVEIPHVSPRAFLMIAEDGGLGFVSVLEDERVYTWSSLQGSEGWENEEELVMDLDMLLPSDPSRKSDVVGVVEGTDTVFINSSDVGLFTLNLKSRQMRMLGHGIEPYDTILPYRSFYIPGTVQVYPLDKMLGAVAAT